jgi:hypothetical protein
MFNQKHSIYVLVFIIAWAIQLQTSYFHLFNPLNYLKDEEHEKSHSKVVDTFSGLFMIVTGLFLGLVRLFEPAFHALIGDFFKRCFGVLEEADSKSATSQNTLSAFLASSLNVELVTIILKGIKRFASVPFSDLSQSDLDGSQD